MKLLEESVKTLRSIATLNALGGNVFDYFIDKGIKKLHIYTNDELGGILYEQAFWQELEITAIYGESKTKYNVDFRERSRIKHIDVQPIAKRTDNSVPIILCSKPDHTIKNGYKMDELIGYSQIKHILFDKVLSYKTEMAPDLRLAVLSLPSLWYVKNKTEYEKGLLKGNMYNKEREMSTYRALGQDDIYIKEALRAFHIDVNEGVPYLVDIAGTYFSASNGYRTTKNVPDNAKHFIYTFGNSICFGMRVDDANTIQSVLQGIINTYSDTPRYNVINCGNGGHPSYGKQWLSFKKQMPQNGDVALFISWFNPLLRDVYKDRFLWINPQGGARLFDRPHDLGEFVWIDRVHYSHIGSRAIGEYLASEMINSGILSGNSTIDENALGSAPKGSSVVNTTPDESLEQELAIGLKDYKQSLLALKPRIGAIVMNCNPFTLGHFYLIEKSAKKVDKLYIFVVEEDKSVFPFAHRIDLVRKGTANIRNVAVIPSGKYIISSLTFSEYFDKSDIQERTIDPTQDIELFAKHIAPTLGITVRFAAEEPLDNITRQYNNVMQRVLPQYGIAFDVIPRLDHGGSVISASRVRKLLNEGNFKEIAELVPKTTLEYLENKYKM